MGIPVSTPGYKKRWLQGSAGPGGFALLLFVSVLPGCIP